MLYYSKICEILSPSKGDLVLDAACGTGEIAFLFHQNEIDIKGCDFSDQLILKAKSRFPDIDFFVDDLMSLKSIDLKYDKILINNAIFYIHPLLLTKRFRSLYSVLKENGKVYLLDWPDFDKRHKVYNKRILYNITYFLPVYQPMLGGFWYKKKWIERSALEAGFQHVQFLDSWAYYRSHAICVK